MASGTKNWNSSACQYLHRFETDDCISCRPKMQSLLCSMAQAKTHLIYNSKAMEATEGLYWLLARRIRSHWHVAPFADDHPTLDTSFCWFDHAESLIILLRYYLKSVEYITEGRVKCFECFIISRYCCFHRKHC